jgi:hypothetical protein
VKVLLLGNLGNVYRVVTADLLQLLGLRPAPPTSRGAASERHDLRA